MLHAKENKGKGKTKKIKRDLIVALGELISSAELRIYNNLSIVLMAEVTFL